MSTLSIVEGWTGPLDFTLEADGVAVNLTGMTVLMQLWDRDGKPVTLSGSSSSPTPSSGLVRFSPAASDLGHARSPLSARWKVTDGSGKIVYFPNGAPDVWTVYKP